MSVLNLLKVAKVVKVNNGAAAGVTLVTSSTIDTSGYNAALIIADLGAVVAGAVMTLQAQEGVQANGSDAANITNGAVTVTDVGGATANGQVLGDVIRLNGTARYLTVTFNRTTQNSTLNSITVILYQTTNPPVTQPSSVVGSFLEGGN